MAVAGLRCKLHAGAATRPDAVLKWLWRANRVSCPTRNARQLFSLHSRVCRQQQAVANSPSRQARQFSSTVNQLEAVLHSDQVAGPASTEQESHTEPRKTPVSSSKTRKTARSTAWIDLPQARQSDWQADVANASAGSVQQPSSSDIGLLYRTAAFYHLVDIELPSKVGLCRISGCSPCCCCAQQSTSI